MAVTFKNHRPDLPDPLQLIAEALSARLSKRAKLPSGELATELHRIIDGPASRPVRLLLLSHLAAEEAREVAVVAQARASLEPGMLTTEEAAELLGCSRPHVAMLIDGGKLPGAVRTEGGHRRVPRAAVLAFKAEQDGTGKSPAGADYVAAGIAAGIYDIPEQAWLKTGKPKRGR